MSGHGDGSAKVILLSLAANLGIAVAKFVGAYLSGSASLLAEAIHSVADCANQMLLLVGLKASKRGPSELHPLGYGRESFFWSFVVALVLFSVGGLFAIYEGVHKLREVEPVGAPLLGFAILGVAVVLEGISFRACLKEVRSTAGAMPLRKWLRVTTSADLLVIFLEDAAALVGLCIAALCLGLAWLTGDPTWDAVGSILVGTLLVGVAFILARETKSLLIGETPQGDYRATVEAAVREIVPGGKLLRFLALQTGASQVLLSYKIDPGAMADVKALIAAINAIERKVRERHPDVAWQYVEPDYE